MLNVKRIQSKRVVEFAINLNVVTLMIHSKLFAFVLFRFMILNKKLYKTESLGCLVINDLNKVDK